MKLIRYFLVGGIAAAVDITLFTLFAYILGFDYLLVGACSFILATLTNYFLSIRFVFVSGVRFTRRHELILVFIISSVGLIINQCILYVFVEYLLFDKLLAKVIATASVFLWNYLCRSQYVFNAGQEK